MLPDVDVRGTSAQGLTDADARDASLAHFAHALGHDCQHCRAIRRLGPPAPGNPLARLIATAQGTVVSEDDAVQRLPKPQRRKYARLAHKRGLKGLLLAMRAA
jgi:hypothetical protein